MRGSGSMSTPKRSRTDGGDAAGEVEQLHAGRVAVVDQHQRVRSGDAGVALAMAFPAALVDQPRGGEFRDAVVVAAERRQRRMPRMQRFGLHGGHDGVLEETARVAEHGRVRQFAAADADHRVGDLRRRRIGDAHRRQFLADAGVIEPRRRRARQREFHRGHDEAFGIALEQRSR